jgi:integrase
MKKKPQDKGLRNRKGQWFINIQVDGQRREFLVGPEKQKAIATRTKLKLMALNGTLQEFLKNEEKQQETITYAESVKEHWDGHLQSKKSGSSMLQYLDNTVKFFGIRDISTLTWQEIEAYGNVRLREVTANYVRKELVMMGAVLERQVKMGRIMKNPMKHVELPEVHDVRDRILTDEEFRSLLSVSWNFKKQGKMRTKGLEHHVRLALVIADYTAMRIGEILSMKWSEVDLDNGVIFIPKSKNGSKRQVPIHDELKLILAAEKRFGDHVVQKYNKPIQSIRKGFNKARLKAKLLDIRIHDFRHRAITRWVQEGKPTTVIMAATGHKTFSAFLRYANLRDGDVQALVGRKTESLPVIPFKEFSKVA